MTLVPRAHLTSTGTRPPAVALSVAALGQLAIVLAFATRIWSWNWLGIDALGALFGMGMALAVGMLSVSLRVRYRAIVRRTASCARP